MSKKARAFTIVELLIVIVVIAILAAISVVAYTGVQQRARDTKRKQDVAQIAKMIALYEVEYGRMDARSGCGSLHSSGNGWISYKGDFGYEKSIEECLIERNIASSVPRDTAGVWCTPHEGQRCQAYMKYNCMRNGQYVTYVYASLEGRDLSHSHIEGSCTSAYVNRDFGMNYAVRVSAAN